MSKYVSASTIRKTYDVTSHSLISWANEGKIQYVRTPGGKRLYHKADVQRLFNEHVPTQHRNGIIYIRVKDPIAEQTSHKRQISLLQSYYPQYAVISDSGAARDYNRKGLFTLFQRIIEGNVSEVVVPDRNCLSSGDSELFAFFFQFYNTKLVVFNEKDRSEGDDLRNDVLEMCHYFLAKCRRWGGVQYQGKENTNISTEGNEEEDELRISCSQTHIQQMCEPIFTIEENPNQPKVPNSEESTDVISK